MFADVQPTFPTSNSTNSLRQFNLKGGGKNKKNTTHTQKRMHPFPLTCQKSPSASHLPSEHSTPPSSPLKATSPDGAAFSIVYPSPLSLPNRAWILSYGSRPSSITATQVGATFPPLVSPTAGWTKHFLFVGGEKDLHPSLAISALQLSRVAASCCTFVVCV